MKTLKRVLTLVLAIGFVASLGAAKLQADFGITPFISFPAIALIVSAAFLLPNPKTYNPLDFSCGIQKEIWEKDIEGNLFKNNDFLLASVDASEYVLQGKVVHIPQAGSKPGVQVDRSSLPATVTQRTDTDITYALNTYTSDPILIPNADLVELSYNKRDSVLSESIETLQDVLADYMLTKWAPASNIYRTSGIPNNDPTAAAVSSPAYTPSATGTRKNFGLYDLRQIKLKLDNAKVPSRDRYGLLDATMMDQLIQDLTNTKYRDFSIVYDPKTGTVAELMGFKLFMRSDVLVYDNTPAVKAYGAAGAISDNAAGLFWQMRAVERSIGEINFYEKIGDPQYYGDIYSFLVRMGGRKRRTNEENIVAAVQQA